MKCPMPVFYRSPPSGLAETEVQECLKEECAWYNKTQEECNFVTIAVELTNISCFLNDIRDKMPAVHP